MNLMKRYEPFWGVGRKYLFCIMWNVFHAISRCHGTSQNKYQRAKRAFLGSLSYIRFIKFGQYQYE
jgi:hypothetical protein